MINLSTKELLNFGICSHDRDMRNDYTFSIFDNFAWHAKSECVHKLLPLG